MGGLDINTVALLHFDESTTKDGCGNTWTLSGTPTIDSNQSKFGGKSLYLNGSSYLTTPSVCNFGTGDFTVDFWAYTPAYNASIPYAVITNSNGGLGISLYSNNLNLARATIANDISTTTISTISSQWNHYAVTRKNGVAYLFVNGALMKSGEWTVNCVSTNTYIGVDGDAANAKFTGYIDEFRVSDTARWTADFTPPTLPYSRGSKLYLDSNNAVWGMKA